MTKPYHITPEQALEIANGLSVVGDEGFIDSDYLEEIINAALDKVLGEPILFACPHYEQLLEHHNGHTLCGGKQSELHTLALYAPKELK